MGKIQISLLLVANAALLGLTVRLWTLWSYYVDALGDAFCGTGRLIASRKIAVLQAPLAVVTLLTLFLFVLHYGRLAEWARQLMLCLLTFGVFLFSMPALLPVFRQWVGF